MSVTTGSISSPSLLMHTDDIPTQNALSPIMKVVLPIFLTLASIALTVAVLIVTGPLALPFYIAIVAFAVAGVSLLILIGFGIHSDYKNSIYEDLPSPGPVPALDCELNSIVEPLLEFSAEQDLKVQDTPFNERLQNSIAQLKQSFSISEPTLILRAIDASLRTLNDPELQKASSSNDLDLLVEKGQDLARLLKKFAENEIQLKSALRNGNEGKIVQHAKAGLKLLKRFAGDILADAQVRQFIDLQKTRLSLFEKMETTLSWYQEAIKEAQALDQLSEKDQSEAFNKINTLLEQINTYKESFKTNKNAKKDSINDADFVDSILRPFFNKLRIICRIHLVKEDWFSPENFPSENTPRAVSPSAIPVVNHSSSNAIHSGERVVSTSPVIADQNAENGYSDNSDAENAEAMGRQAKSKRELEASAVLVSQPEIAASPSVAVPSQPTAIVLDVAGEIVNAPSTPVDTPSSAEAFLVIPQAPDAPPFLEIVLPTVPSAAAVRQRKASIAASESTLSIAASVDSVTASSSLFDLMFSVSAARRSVVKVESDDEMDDETNDAISQASNHSNSSVESEISTNSSNFSDNTAAAREARRKRRASLDQESVEKSKKLLAESAKRDKGAAGPLPSVKIPKKSAAAAQATTDNDGWGSTSFVMESSVSFAAAEAAAAPLIKKIDLSKFGEIEKMAQVRSQEIQSN